TSTNLMHTYAKPGVYNIRLMITGASCSDTARNTVRIETSTPVLQVSPVKSFYCKYDTVKFITSNYDSADVRFFSWKFGDGTSRSSLFNAANHIYDSAGNFKPTGYIRD